jgi:hypothetical protein
MTRSRQTADWGSRAGLAKIVPSSVAVGSGTGSADSLGNVTFSGVSSVSLNNVFSSAYSNYRIIVSGLTAAATASLSIRLRANGTDESSGSNFYKNHVQGVYATGTTFAYGSNGSNAWEFVLYQLNTSDNAGGVVELELQNTFASVTTSGFMRCYAWQADTTTRTNRVGGMAHTAQASYDGFSLIPTTSNMSGSIAVYGYTE